MRTGFGGESDLGLLGCASLPCVALGKLFLLWNWLSKTTGECPRSHGQRAGPRAAGGHPHWGSTWAE